MSTAETDNLTTSSGVAWPAVRTQSTPNHALASNEPYGSSQLWTDAIERMLSWHSNLDQFDQGDRPDLDILESALDYSIDSRREGDPAPTSIIPSGSGRIAIEWSFGRKTVIIEFHGQGQASLMWFAGSELVGTAELQRNPRTRRLETGA